MIWEGRDGKPRLRGGPLPRVVILLCLKSLLLFAWIGSNSPAGWCCWCCCYCVSILSMLLLPSASHTNICLQWLFFCVAVCVLVDDREVVALSMGLLLAPFLRSTVHILLHVCMSPCRASSSSLCTATATTAVNTTTLGGYDSAMHTRRFNSNNNYSHYYIELHGPEYTTTTTPAELYRRI